MVAGVELVRHDQSVVTLKGANTFFDHLEVLSYGERPLGIVTIQNELDIVTSTGVT